MADADSEHRAKPDHIVSRSQKALSFVSRKAWLLSIPFIALGVSWGLHTLYTFGSFSFSDSSSETSDTEATTSRVTRTTIPVSTEGTMVRVPSGCKVDYSSPPNTEVYVKSMETGQKVAGRDTYMRASRVMFFSDKKFPVEVSLTETCNS